MRKALYVIITCIFIMSFAMCGTLQISAASKTKNTTGNKTKSETTSTQKDKETEKCQQQNVICLDKYFTVGYENNQSSCKHCPYPEFRSCNDSDDNNREYYQIGDTLPFSFGLPFSDKVGVFYICCLSYIFAVRKKYKYDKK